MSNFFDDIKQHDWRDLYHRMKDDFDNTDFNYPELFGGKDTTKFPNRAGYWLGVNLVSQYINQHGGCAVTLVDKPAENFAELQI